MSLSMILKFFFNFGRFEPCDSYKLYSYKKESVYHTMAPCLLQRQFRILHLQVKCTNKLILTNSAFL